MIGPSGPSFPDPFPSSSTPEGSSARRAKGTGSGTLEKYSEAMGQGEIFDGKQFGVKLKAANVAPNDI